MYKVHILKKQVYIFMISENTTNFLQPVRRTTLITAANLSILGRKGVCQYREKNNYVELLGQS